MIRRRTLTYTCWLFPLCAAMCGCPSPDGALKCVIEPAEAREAGAQWRLRGGDWLDSGVVVTGLSDGWYGNSPSGTQTVSFSPVAGWTTPKDIPVTIVGGTTITITGTYRREGEPLFRSNLPLIVIDTDGETIIDEPKINVNMTVIWDPSGGDNYVGSTHIDFDGKIGIELRGQSSQRWYDKKQYGLEIRDEADQDLNASLLGMPEQADWVLYGPYADKSLIRNFLIYELSNQIGSYAPRCKFVEMFLNDDGGTLDEEDHYVGLYALTEKIKRDPARVPISQLTELDNGPLIITGGYLLEMSPRTKLTQAEIDNEAFIETPLITPNLVLVHKYPRCDRITAQQKQYIQDYVCEFENVLYSEDFRHVLYGYRQYIDVPSFIDHMLLNELANNIDAFMASAFMYKKRNGLLYMGPIWDFNITFGNNNLWYPTFADSVDSVFDPRHGKVWATRLFDDPDFVEQYRARWQQLRQNEFHLDNILTIIDELTDRLGEAQARNFDRWPILNTPVWPNDPDDYGPTWPDGSPGDETWPWWPYEDAWPDPGTWEGELQDLKNWIQDRVAWLDENI